MQVFIAGCGTMGSGIIQTFAVTGHEVYMYDIKQEFVDRGYDRIDKQLKRQVEKGRMTQEEADASMARLHKTVQLDDARNADLVLEAIFEEMSVKRELFGQLDQICGPDCLFLSNTSSLSVTEMAHGYDHESKFLGFHFFNPAPVMKLIEIIRGANTSDEAVEKAKEIATAIGKTPVLVHESPGFVVNRILIPMINEAIDLVDRGVASPEDIDTAMQLGANHPMGPLALGDLIGLDIVLNIMEVLYHETGDSKYRPSPLLKQMTRAGKLGRKTKQGFYKY
ncbi:MAG: 3-hydroxyacyl-CoA dehydrogenase NAD-binding domain-containing protein [Eubacteriales bacterium]|nr:3-hydroxyacyl-CoA dehydrogenase NAD-binding domain-containing protein [Eubacteriales bacterium]